MNAGNWQAGRGPHPGPLPSDGRGRAIGRGGVLGGVGLADHAGGALQLPLPPPRAVAASAGEGPSASAKRLRADRSDGRGWPTGRVRVASGGSFAVLLFFALLGLLGLGAPAALARTVSVLPAAVTAGNPVDARVRFQSDGDENALAFSLTFDPARLRYRTARAALTGVVLNLNTNGVAQGRLGVVMGKPAGQRFVAGTADLVIVEFLSLPGAGETPIGFGDQPIPRGAAGLLADDLPVTFQGGAINVATAVRPTILAGPNPVRVVRGGPARFEVLVEGTAPMQFWWRRNGTPIEGGTNATLELPAVTPDLAGEYSVRVANVVDAVESAAALLTLLPGAEGTGLVGQYYDNRDFTAWKLARLDAGVDFNFGNASPHASIAADTFAVRWSGFVEARHSEAYTFSTVSDEGVRLWVDDQLVIDHWANHGATENLGAISLAAGQRYPIRLEYFENTGPAQIRLSWSSATQAKQVVPATQLYPPEVYIVRQPESQQRAPGESVTFGVEAIGTGPLTYQWRFNGGDLPGATAPALLRSALEADQFGTYDVLVRRGAATVTSEPALLGQTPITRELKVVNTDITADSTGVVGLQFTGVGDENSLGFGLAYDPALLTFRSASLGAASAGGVLIVNTNDLASGRVGILVARAPGFSFGAGAKEVVRVQFQAGTQGGAAAIAFSDDPVRREVADASGNARLANFVAGTVTVRTLPRITTQPQDRDVFVGGSAIFAVSAVGSPPLTYQWRRGGEPIGGATSSSLFLGNVGAAEAGEYTVVVSNGAGSVESTPARLRVERLLRFVNRTVAEGAEFELPVELLALGDENALGFSLEFDPTRLTPLQAGPGVSVPAASVIVNTAQGAAGKVGFALGLPAGTVLGDRTQEVARIRFRAASGAGPATVRFADVPVRRELVDRLAREGAMKVQDGQVTIVPLPVILTQPQTQTVEAGKTASFTVVARGTGTLAYQWFYEGNPLDGATRATLSLPNVRLDQGGVYRVIVTDAVGAVTSADARLTVSPDTTGPVVVEFTPTGRLNTAVTNVQFRFSEAVQVDTLTRDDVQLTTPGGVLPAEQIEIRRINETLFQAIFPSQAADGAYAVQIGPAVTDVFGNPMPSGGYRGTFVIDRTGPVLANLRFGGTPLANGAVVRTNGILSLDAADDSGVNRVEFYADTQAIGTDSDPAGGFAVAWNLEFTPDGPHTLEARGFDALGNPTSLSVPVIVAMAPPPPPVITSPSDGTSVNDILIVLRGTTARNTTVVFYRNGSEVGSRVPVTVSGVFEAPVPLADGTNQLQVSAVNRGGEGAKSPVLRVIVDRTVPAPPVGVQARARDAGRVQLDWVNPGAENVRGYRVYRATTAFTERAEAARITPTPVAELRFADVPPADGPYFYRVSTVNGAGTEGTLSALVNAVSDATPPAASRVEVFPEGNFDPASGRYGTGPIRVEVTMSEPLLAPPFLSLTPSNGVPIVLDLSLLAGAGSPRYEGRLVVTSETPSGPADLVLSARDAVGNRGTAIIEGARVLNLDTAGPQVVDLLVAPTRVLHNDAAAPLTAVFTARLDSAIRGGTTPEFSYSLSATQPEAAPVTSVEPGPDPLTWVVRVALPPGAGVPTEALELAFRAEDSLRNVGTRILPTHRFQVYQGDLPPLESPVGLVAKGLPAGRVELRWQPVPEAVDYAVFRKAATAADFEFLLRTGGGTSLEDLPAADGTYQYVVATVRRENGQESVGAQSFVVAAVSDRVPPGAPREFVLQLASNGVFARWQPPLGALEAITYGLARAATGPITTVEGVTPYRQGIPVTQVVDPSPDPAQGYYAAFAVDGVGNRSLPSNTDYLNVQLLPVRTLAVEQRDGAAPVVSWTQASLSATGYDLYLGPDTARRLLNADGPLTTTSFTDSGYAGDDRRYTVVTRDATGHESLGRSLVLPSVRWELAPDARVRRGLMNRLAVEVRSQSAYPLERARLKLALGGRDHVSEDFSLPAGGATSVGVVVGGYSDLPDGATALRVTLENRPNEGELASLSQPGSVAVGDGQLVVGVLPREFTRGGSGTVQFSLLNPGEVEVEVLTARGGGASPDIRFNLLDADGNVLGSSPFLARSGPGIVNLSNGDSVMRLGPGAEALSPAFAVAVPDNAPNLVYVQVQIDRVYHHADQPDRVEMQGLQTRTEVPIVDTTYTGAVTLVVPAESTGDQEVRILGGAILRSTGGPRSQRPAAGQDRQRRIRADRHRDHRRQRRVRNDVPAPGRRVGRRVLGVGGPSRPARSHGAEDLHAPSGGGDPVAVHRPRPVQLPRSP
jgi:hypothetical protein